MYSRKRNKGVKTELMAKVMGEDGRWVGRGLGKKERRERVNSGAKGGLLTGQYTKKKKVRSRGSRRYKHKKNGLEEKKVANGTRIAESGGGLRRRRTVQ